MTEPCHCSKYDPSCDRFPGGMTYRRWQLCSGDAGCGPYISEKYREAWDRLSGRSVKGPTWSYGVTTVPNRIDLLHRTLKSLDRAGFSSPRLFIDGARGGEKYCNLGLETTFRYPRVYAAGNWVLSLYELYIRSPNSTYYAVFQDDFVTYKNLRQYLEQCDFPENGYWNLYTFPENQELAKTSLGWCRSNQLGRGAVAIVLDLPMVVNILSSRHLTMRPQMSRRGWRAIDGGVVTAAAKEQKYEYVHSPSLTQHTGHESSTYNDPQPMAPVFMGEEFDALDLLDTSQHDHISKEVQYQWDNYLGIDRMLLGDRFEKALSLVGITKTKVERWIGKGCGCDERQRRMNQIDLWARQVLSGAMHNAKQRLAKIIK